MKAADVIMADVMAIDMIQALNTSSRDRVMTTVVIDSRIHLQSNKPRHITGALNFQSDHAGIMKSCSVRAYYFPYQTIDGFTRYCYVPPYRQIYCQKMLPL